MSREPNKFGSNDNRDALDDLDQKYERQTRKQAGEETDDDPVSVPGSTPSSPDDLDVTTDSAKPFLKSTAENSSSRDPAPAETYDNQPPSAQVPSIEGTRAPSKQQPSAGRSQNMEVAATRVGESAQSETDEDDFLVLSDTRRREQLPESIGRYEIKRLLGEGAFGKVYQARDSQLDRQVAVKVAKSISGKTQVTRFVREARAAAQLRHPNIIPVYEYGLVDDQNIIVYEFVEGETLRSMIRRKKKLQLDEAIKIVRAIAEGLHYAHDKGIIHRDMKPDNILIDATGHPHIADFGCARSIDDETNLTIDGSILGTPMYMSPEQASGNASLADARTDIWSLGVMLYEMVSGVRPFEGQLTDLLFWICNNNPAPLRKVAPETPIEIETLCDRCLTRELDKRLRSAETLADELGRFQRGEPIESRRIGPFVRTWMWAKRNRAVASLLATVVVTMLIGTIVSSVFAIKAYSEQRRRAFAQMNAITTSEANALPKIFDALAPYRATVLPQLKGKLAASETTDEERPRIRMAIIELEEDPVVQAQLADQMLEDLLVARPDDFFVCRKCLEFRKDELITKLWDAARDHSDASSSQRRFRAAAALALYDPESTQWETVAPDVAGFLTSLNQIEMSHWLPSLELIRESLKPALFVAYRSRGDQLDTTPQHAAAILSRMFADEVPFLVNLVPAATPPQIPHLTETLQNRRSEAVKLLQSHLEKIKETPTSNLDLITQKANVVSALIQLSDDFQWHHFNAGRDVSVATELIERLGPSSTPLELVTMQVNQWKTIDSDVLSSILLSLGQFKQNQVSTVQRENLRTILLAIFSEHPDPRVHSSARWLLSQWGFDEDIARREKQLRRKTPDPNKDWHVDLAGNTFALYGPYDSFEMGLNKDLPSYTDFKPDEIFNEPVHHKQIPRRFGICIHEVTVGQFRDFEIEILNRMREKSAQLDEQLAELKASADLLDKDPADRSDAGEQNAADSDPKKLKQLARAKKIIDIRIKEAERASNRRKDVEDDLPVGDVNYFAALAYCRWVSEQQGTECGLPTIEHLQRFVTSQTDFKLTQSHLDRLGYRLPTATEWEFACRGQSQTLFPFGRDPQPASQYAWFATNSSTRLHPVGQLKPGNTGLFDVLGNVSEWCLDWYREQLPPVAVGAQPNTYVDFGPELEAHQGLSREYRGGSFADEIFDVRSTKRFSMRPSHGFPRLGFRMARTYQPSTSFDDHAAAAEAD